MAVNREDYKLDDVFQSSNQGVNTTTENVSYSESGIKVIRAKNISPYRIDYDDVAYVDDPTFSKLKTPVKPNLGDVLYTNIGSQLGSAAKVSTDETIAIAWNVFRIVPNHEIVDSNFLVSFLNNPVTREYVRNLDSSSTMPFVSGKVLRNIAIQIPTLPEQKRIAHILGTLNDKIELNRQMNQTLEAMAQALFKSWFVDFDPVIDNALSAGNPIPDELQTRASLRAQLHKDGEAKPLPEHIQWLFPNSFIMSEEMGWIPEGWEVQSVYNSANYINGAAYKSDDFTIDESGLPVIKIAEIKNGISAQTKFTKTSKGDKYRIRNGDILLSWSGNPDTSIDTFIWTGGEGWLNQHIFKVAIHDVKDMGFIYYQLKYLRKTFADIARDKQTTGLGHFTAADMKRLFIFKPDNVILFEFNKIIEPFYLHYYENLISNLHLSKLRDTLLPKLISGELRIPDAQQQIKEAAA